MIPIGQQADHQIPIRKFFENKPTDRLRHELNGRVQQLTTRFQLVFFRPTVHESVGEDHDRVVEVSVLLSDHAERRSLLLLRRIPRRDAGRQVDDDHVGGWMMGDKKVSD